MKRSAALLLFALAGWPLAAAAQESSNLNETQRHGQQLLAQTCGVCHLKGDPNARTYGPALNKAAANGDDDIMRDYIQNGTPRMPGFKYYLKDDEISAIISFVRTVPVPAAAPAR